MKSIVLAEDNPGDVFLIRRALDSQGILYSLLVARDGEGALRFVSDAEAGLIEIDLILLDLNLPRHDGAEVLSKVRSTDHLVGVPVVVLTSSDSPRDEQRCLALGATRYFQKPTDLKRFMEVGKIAANLIQESSPNPG